MPAIADFINNATGTRATEQQIQDALITGNYGGLTGIDADGKPVPAGSPLAPELLSGLPARFSSSASAQNYLLWGIGIFAVWYFFLRRK